MVANLWDVTDRDIDRFSQALLRRWMGQEGDQQDNTSTAMSASGTQVVHTATTVSGAVSRSRAACKLPHLIGAAPVCYGLPVAVLWPSS